MATIERGRTNNVLGNGDDMPTWGQLYGGPLTDQQINDIIDWLQTIQRPVSAASS
jgi:mono/diheme cytochrome c family protein